jgi:hypothetical protein
MRKKLLSIAFLIIQLVISNAGFGQHTENREKPRWINEQTLPEKMLFETGQSQNDTIINGNELSPLAYCVASGGCSEHISRFQAGSINNTTACSGYANYTATRQTVLPINGILWVAVTNGAPFAGDQCGILVDWNRDSDFSDANETITVSGTPGLGPYAASFAPPAGTTTGQVTMRVRITWTGAVSPCGTTAHGKVEDYSIILTSASTINSWNGTYSNDWHTPANWSLGSVPTSSTSVYIPAGVPQPIINNYAYCLNLFLDTGATLTHSSGSLSVSGDFDAGFGQYNMTSPAAVLSFVNTIDALWWDDNQNDIYTNIKSYKSTTSRLVLQNNVTCSGTVQIFGGKLEIPDGRILTITSNENDAFYFGSMGSPFEDGTLRLLPGGIVKVTGGIRFTEKSKSEITGGAIYCGGNLRFTNLPGYDINLSNSTLIMKGAGDQFIQHETTSLLTLGNLTINKPMNTVYLANAALTINGSLNINSGKLSAYNSAAHTASYDIKITGDWANAAFPTGFEPGNAKVIFNSGGYQFITTNENFNVLQTAMNDVLFFYNSGTTVTCNVYNWISGGIELYPGATFTALDLAQQGLFGRFWVNPGAVINLYQDAGQWVDINGHLKFNGGGNINIYGGNGDSWWAFIGNTTLDMSGGVLDFKNSGITVQTSGSSLTMNLTSDAVIRTTGGINASRTGFAPTNGTFEFYGSSDRFIICGASNSLPNIKINKSATSDEGGIESHPNVDLHDGSVITDGSRANNISLSSNVTVSGNLTIQSGTLTLSGRTLNVGNDCTVYGTLKMTNALDILNAGTSSFHDLAFKNGSVANITQGNLNAYGWLTTEEGCDFLLPETVMVSFKGSSGGGPDNRELSARYGSVSIDKNPGHAAYISNWSTQPVILMGNLTVKASNSFYLQDQSLTVFSDYFDTPTSTVYLTFASFAANAPVEESRSGNPENRGGYLAFYSDVNINGNLNMGDGELVAYGIFNTAVTSTVSIANGYFRSVLVQPDAWNVFSGNLIMTDGIMEFENSSLRLNGMPKNVSGGVIKTGRNFNATTPNIFQPTGGTVEFAARNYYNEMNCYNGNYFYNLNIASELMIYEIHLIQPAPLYIKKNLNIAFGQLHSHESDIYIEGDWNITYPNFEGFIPNLNKVTFNGNTNQTVVGHNTFYNLENDKTGGELKFYSWVNVENNFLANNLNTINANYFNVNGTLDLSIGNLRLEPENIAEVTVNHFLMGGVLEVLGGTFTANDLVNNGIFGSFKISGADAVCNLHQDALQFVDLNAEILLEDGEMNIFGGVDDSWWTYGGPVNLQMPGGILDFKDVGVFVYNSPTHYLSTWISGGYIRTTGSFVIENPNFAPWGGDVELYGGLSSVIKTTAGNFHHLTINKSGDFDDLPLTFKNRNGKTINRTRANEVVMAGNVKFQSTLNINAGKLNTGISGNDLICTAPPYSGAILIDNGGTLELEPQTELRLGQLLNVNPLGTFISKGTPGQEVLVTKASANNYLFQVLPYGKFSAEHTIFEYMDINGISIDNGTWIDPEKAFNYCTFREGLADEPLLYINNDQDLVCTGTVFPENAWGSGSNVKKSEDSGHVTFVNASGGFAGPAYEDDPFNIVDWVGPAMTQTLTIPAGWSGLSSFVMPSEHDLPTLISPLAGNLVIMQTMTGFYEPTIPVNTIGDWLSQSAYKVKMNSAATIPFPGNTELDKTYDMSGGWNLVPVIHNTPVDLVTLFSGTSLIIAKDVAGIGVYWPAYGINTLGHLLPGRAYYTLMGSSGSINFPPYSKDDWSGSYPEVKFPSTPWNDVSVSPSSHLIAIEADGMDILKPGDLLGVFSPQGVCFGVTEMTEIETNLILTAFSDDPYTSYKDGFDEMEFMSYKVYRPATGETFDLEVEYNLQLPQTGYFTGEGLSAIKILNLSATGVNNELAAGISVYPNPTGGQVWITGISNFTQIDLIGSLGTMIKTIVNDGQSTLSIDLSGLQPGVYQVKLTGEKGTVVKRVVKK